MGYKHCWGRPATLEPATFEAITTDFRRLLGPLEKAGVRLGDAFGAGRPKITRDVVAFNGSNRCQCRRKRQNSPGAQVLMDLFFETDGNLDAVLQKARADRDSLHDLDWGQRRCNGGCTFETFLFERVVDVRFPSWEEGRAYDCCKTNRRPYDLAVTSFLLICRRHLGEALHVTSDSRERWWDEPRELCQEVLGYGRGMVVAEPWEEREPA